MTDCTDMKDRSQSRMIVQSHTILLNYLLLQKT